MLKKGAGLGVEALSRKLRKSSRGGERSRRRYAAVRTGTSNMRISCMRPEYAQIYLKAPRHRGQSGMLGGSPGVAWILELGSGMQRHVLLCNGGMLTWLEMGKSQEAGGCGPGCQGGGEGLSNAAGD